MTPPGIGAATMEVPAGEGAIPVGVARTPATGPGEMIAADVTDPAAPARAVNQSPQPGRPGWCAAGYSTPRRGRRAARHGERDRTDHGQSPGPRRLLSEEPVSGGYSWREAMPIGA